MNAVSNASPLINLAWIGKLHLLFELYGKITIPEAVWIEVTKQGQNQPGSKEVKEANWIDVQRVADQDLIRSFQRDLDTGESEAIALAIQIGADLLLMDERLGREIAGLFNLRVVGVIGVLIEAKHKGLIREVKPCLDQLRVLAGFYINPALFERIVREEGEV
jgi:predicted nucleic acid-binding protein